MTGVMGEFRNETIRRLFIGLGVLVALYLGFVMMPIAQVPCMLAVNPRAVFALL